jgi:hypothetical protein
MQLAHGSAGIAIYAPHALYGPVRNVFDACRSITTASGWALEIESFLGPVKRHRADRRVPFGAQKTHAAVVKTGIGRKRVRGMPGVLE